MSSLFRITPLLALVARVPAAGAYPVDLFGIGDLPDLHLVFAHDVLTIGRPIDG